MTLRFSIKKTVLLSSIILSTQAQAAGFYLQEQGVTGLGHAFAGEAAAANDASTIYFNPAGMTQLEGAEFQLNAHAISPSVEIKNLESTASAPVYAGDANYAGEDAGNPYSTKVLPNLYYAHPLNEKTWLGFGVAAPFGLGNEYDKDSFARYDSTNTELTTVEFLPSIAYQMNDKLSLGGGLNIEYAEANLVTALPAPESIDPSTDGSLDLEADGWATGFNFGLQYQASDATRWGVHYRSEINHTLEGDETTVRPDSEYVGGPDEVKAGEAELNLPSMFSLAVTHQFSEKMNVLAQLTWFGWETFEEIRIQHDDGSDDIVIEQNYKDTTAIAIGLDYLATDQWTIRAGLQSDPTPTQDGYRNTRTPDGDRTWVNVGASYKQDKHWSFDIAYSHIDVAEEEINLTRAFYVGTGVDTTVNIDGTTASGKVDILAAGLRYRF